MITERPVHGRPPGARVRAARVASAETRRDPIAVFRAYLALTKPQIVELLLVTTVPALMLAAGGWPDLRILAVVLIGGALAGGLEIGLARRNNGIRSPATGLERRGWNGAVGTSLGMLPWLRHL